MKRDLLFIALPIAGRNNLPFTLRPPPVSSPYHGQNILYKVCEFRKPTLWLRTLWRLPIALGEVLNTCWEALYELSPVSLYTQAIPRPFQHVAISVFPLLRTSLSPAYSYACPQSLLKWLIFRKASPRYLIQNGLYHSLPAYELYFSSNHLNYVLICFCLSLLLEGGFQ